MQMVFANARSKGCSPREGTTARKIEPRMPTRVACLGSTPDFLVLIIVGGR
jgi:hypothetical protein